MDKEKAKQEVEKIVKKFQSYPKSELDSMSEDQIKTWFIEPLFEALGWDRYDMFKEERVLKGRADYILKINNEESLVIEAKKTNINLSEEEGRQAVSYAYHRKIKFAVLTNFKEIRVYHALSNIKNIDKNLLKFEDGGYFRLNFENFLKNIDSLLLLSKESINSKGIDILLSKKDERAAKPIDVSILRDLLQIRDWLSKDLKKLRTYLKNEQIDEAIQVLIDRLIFMRSVEDRGIEERDFLLKIVTDYDEGRTSKRIWETLKIKFKIFDKEYNSKLFAESLLESEKDIFFDDDVLRKVIKSLYFGSQDHQERYMFDEIPGDLLGNIYEQYLGTVLQGTEKRVKLELQSGKRKKLGIYYTPSYIVDYIVKNTVGEYIKDKAIDEILDVKILDPACGSGSFLIRAFQEVCDIVEEKLKNGERGKSLSFDKYYGKISLAQKAMILSNCIYGVDLDEKAVELAQLNLLLKMLENEGRDIPNKRLPNLLSNVKNGNSLIDDSSVAGDKAFNWKAQFPDVFKQGGFDVVIGNPPYVRIQTLSKKDVDYFNKTYESPEKNYDIYVLFVEKGFKILKERGCLGYILPNKFISSQYGVKLRSKLTERLLVSSLVDFGDQQVFEGATTYTCLLFLSNSDRDSFRYTKVSNLSRWSKNYYEEKSTLIDTRKLGESWTFGSRLELEIGEKLGRIDITLGSISKKIFQGLITGADSVFILDKEKEGVYFSRSEESTVSLEEELLHPLCKGSLNLKRYYIDESQRFVLFPYKVVQGKVKLLEKEELIKEYPLVWNYLKRNRLKLESREGGKWKNEKWYSFSRNQNMAEMTKSKILTPSIAKVSSFSVDITGKYYFVGSGGGGGGGYGILLKENIKLSEKFVLGVLNSRLTDFVIKSSSSLFRGGYYAYNRQYIEKIPIQTPEKDQEKKIVSLVDQMLSLQKQLHEGNPTGYEKEKLEQQIKNVDYEIDQEVYKLYGITEEEQRIIESSLNK